MFGLKSGKSVKTNLPCLSRFGTSARDVVSELVVGEDGVLVDSPPVFTTLSFLMEAPSIDDVFNDRLGAIRNSTSTV